MIQLDRMYACFSQQAPSEQCEYVEPLFRDFSGGWQLEMVGVHRELSKGFSIIMMILSIQSVSSDVFKSLVISGTGR